MKKALFILLVILAFGTACIYIFIPKEIVVNHVVPVRINDFWAFKYISDTAHWRKWWPKSDDAANGNSFEYKNQRYTLDTLYYNAATINIERDGNNSRTRLMVLPNKGDFINLGWEYTIHSSLNPVTRLKQYQNAVMIKDGMKGILESYKKWLSVTENVYGFNVIPSKIIDTVLVARRVMFRDNYPTPVQVDSILNIIRVHIKEHNSKQSGYPMLNVIKKADGWYDVQVAIPVNRAIPETTELKIKRMFPGNALITRFKGGPYTIQKAYEACENYRMAHLAVSPAVPFQSMVTDRVKEPDTSKWETILYFPVR